ncbi:hypothetical protein K449DRAFT_391673 [Hypoxylon sp. EC38]|nr:hypothetical protein K449DRAFT_391673 [Hypoxylon sp. EC38]
MPVQSHYDYMDGLIELVYQHDSLDSLCDTLRKRQQEMAAQIYKAVKYNLNDIVGNESKLFPGEDNPDQRFRIYLSLMAFARQPCAEALGKYINSFISPVGQTQEQSRISSTSTTTPLSLPAPTFPKSSSLSSPPVIAPVHSSSKDSPGPCLQSTESSASSSTPTLLGDALVEPGFYHPTSESLQVTLGNEVQNLGKTVQIYGLRINEILLQHDSIQHPDSETQQDDDDSFQAKRKRRDSTSSSATTTITVDDLNKSERDDALREQRQMDRLGHETSKHLSCIRNGNDEKDGTRHDQNDEASEGDDGTQTGQSHIVSTTQDCGGSTLSQPLPSPIYFMELGNDGRDHRGGIESQMERDVGHGP